MDGDSLAHARQNSSSRSLQCVMWITLRTNVSTSEETPRQVVTGWLEGLVGSGKLSAAARHGLPQKVRDHDQYGRAATGHFTAELRANSERAPRLRVRLIAEPRVNFIGYVMPQVDLRLLNRITLLSGP